MYPPASLELQCDNSRFLCFYRGAVIGGRKAACKLGNTLRKSYLAELFILRNGAPASRGVKDKLIGEGFIGGAQRGVVDC